MGIKPTCDICGRTEPNLREECYEGKLIGPEIEPGLVLGSNHNAFYVVYGELSPEGHQRNYYWERVDVLENSLLPWLRSLISVSELESSKNQGIIRKASDAEVEILNDAIENEIPMSSLIKVVLDEKGVEKLHNRTDYFD